MKINNTYRFIVVLSIFVMVCLSVFAQETIVVGEVFDSRDKTPLPEVNVILKNTTQGVKTDNEGFFLIRINGQEPVLQFSCIGYATKEVKIKPGKNVGIQVYLQEQNTVLQEVFVIPGANPAIPLMNRVRAKRSDNNYLITPVFGLNYNEQNVAYLGNMNRRNMNKKLFETLSEGKEIPTDSSLFMPVYLNENEGSLLKKELTELKRDTYKASEQAVQLMDNLFAQLDAKFSFYDNYVNVLGINFLSPIASGAGAYYDFYLTDSLHGANGKMYKVRFKTKNPKNQIFNGTLYVDSVSAALQSAEAELPLQSNVNYIQQLKIRQSFTENKLRIPERSQLFIRLNQSIISDTTMTNPVMYLKKVVTFSVGKDTVVINPANFAQTGYSKSEIEQKMNLMNEVPVVKVAKWLAGVIITGYIPAGIFDIGKIQQITRYNDIEGWRFTLPFKTNEKLLRNFSVGGYAGYGFKNNELQYSALMEYKLPFKNRQLLSASYTKDYRRIDYNYNNFLIREKPLLTGDDDISSSVFALNSTAKLSLRKEFEATLTNEWSRNFETFLTFRNNIMFSNAALPLTHNGVDVGSVSQSSLVFTTRWSFGEKVYDRHLQRIYIQNRKPVIYLGVSGGKSYTPQASGYFGKLFLSVKQNCPFTLGTFNYHVNAAISTGAMPYSFLDFPQGNEGGYYSYYRYNLMNYQEYAADRYIGLQSELITNGLLFNLIPVVRDFKLRELVSFKMIYGSLNNQHNSMIDIPANIYTYNKPYSEIGVGITNILGLFAVQSVWRLTDLNHPGVSTWAIKTAIKVSF